MIIMDKTYILSLVTIFATMILGIISKKSDFINNNLIPIQNLLIGLIFAIIEWIITKDFKMAIAMSGLIAGGTYDIVKNLNDIKKRDKFSFFKILNGVPYAI